MTIRALILVAGLVLASACDGRAETLHGVVIGSKKVSGQILKVSVGSQISVEIEVSPGVVEEVEIARLDSQNEAKVITWMTREARANGARLPLLKFSASQQFTTDADRSESRNATLATRGRQITHTLAVMNSGTTVIPRISLRRVARQVRKVSARGGDRQSVVFWQVDGLELLAGLQPGEVQKMPFPTLYETNSRTSTSVTMKSATGATVGTASGTLSEEVKVQVAYLVALDAAGRLIFFTKI